MPNDLIPPSSYYRDKFQSLNELLIKTGLWCAFQPWVYRYSQCICRQACAATAVPIHPCTSVEILVRDDLSPHTLYSSCPLTVPDQPAPRCILGIHREPVCGPLPTTKICSLHLTGHYCRDGVCVNVCKTNTGRKIASLLWLVEAKIRHFVLQKQHHMSPNIHLWLKPVPAQRRKTGRSCLVL